MRINIRLKLRNYTFFFMISHTQKLEGITSLIDIENKLHIPIWDIENTTLVDVETSLKIVQNKYRLSDIYIMSDRYYSYRAICFSQVDFKTLCHILLDTYYLDYNFFYWTIQRSKATIRFSQKLNRENIKVVSLLESYPTKIPTGFEYVKYDTGNDKIGINIIKEVK